jgi:hypothetical protein
MPSSRSALVPETKLKQSKVFSNGGDFDSDLSISHKVEAPSIEEVLRAAKLAIKLASKTIEEQGGDRCGCF